MTRRMPRRPPDLGFFEAIASIAPAVDDDLAVRRVAQERRRQSLDAANPSITTEDRQNIIRGDLKPTLALRTTQVWTEAIVRPKAGAPAPTTFLMLVGERGRGKTVACAYVAANELCRFVTGPELSQLQVQARFNRQASEQLVQIHAAGLLILDDLCRDTCPPKEEHDALYNLVHARQRNGYHTLITTNHGMGVLRERLGDFVADRLEHSGLIVKLTGQNLRRTG